MFLETQSGWLTQDDRFLGALRAAMAAEPSRLSAPVFRLREDELPPELILSIERILDLHAKGEPDPLSRLTNDFNPIGVLNDYFPDGEPSTL